MVKVNAQFSPSEVDASRPLTRLAWWVTQIGSPPILGLIAGLIVAASSGQPAGWWQMGLYTLLTLLLPLAYIFWLLRRGEISDFHMPLRQERLKPMGMSLATAVCGWLLLLRLAAPPLLLALATANLLQSFLYALITLRWKISIHAAVAAALATLSWHIWGSAVFPLAAGVPLVAWSRVYLRRHTVAQTVVGTAVGAGILLLALYLHGA